MFLSAPFDPRSNRFVFIVEMLDPRPCVDEILVANGFNPGTWCEIRHDDSFFKPDDAAFYAYSFGRGVHRALGMDSWGYSPVPVLMRTGDGLVVTDVNQMSRLIRETGDEDSQLAYMIAELRVAGEKFHDVAALLVVA